MLVDSHCHLDFPDFAADLDGTVARAGQAGVGMMLTIGTSLGRFPGVRAVAERFDNIYCTVGIHPHEADAEPDVDVEKLIALADHPKVVGFGETGLDYFYEHSSRERQQQSFRVHIAAARQTGLPLIIHTRDADADMVAILEEEYAKGPFPGLVHCFSSSQEVADKAIKMGLYISLSGIITFNKAEGLRQIVETLPLERLLVETDSPYLAPTPKRGKSNEPAFVAYTALKLAAIKQIASQQIADITTDNFMRLFSKVPR